MDAKQVWRAALGELQVTLSPANFETWLRDTALVEATPQEYRERGRFKIDNLGKPSWAHPVVAGGRLYIRNQNRLAAYDVKAP